MVNKRNNILLIFSLSICFITSYIQTDVYVTTFPDMLRYFATTEEILQLITSANFFGTFLACLFFGPLSDSMGRKKLLIFGLLLYCIGAIGAAISTDIWWLIFARFIMGIATAAPITIGFTIIFDLFSDKKAASMIAMFNGITSTTIIGGPIIGSWLSIKFSWVANFYLLLLLGFISLFSIIFFYKESHPEKKRTKLSIRKILKDYYVISTHPEFMIFNFFVTLGYAAILVYISNLSLIFIDYLGIDKKTFAFYQATSTISFAIFSLLASKMVHGFGMKKIASLGNTLIAVGSIGFLSCAIWQGNVALLIVFSMSIIFAGIAMSMVVYGTFSMQVFPNKRGACSAVAFSSRQMFTAIMLWLSGVFFDGTILPVASFIFIFFVIGFICYIYLLNSKKRQA